MARPNIRGINPAKRPGPRKNALMVPCPACGAKKGESCHRPKGGVHKSRKKAAVQNYGKTASAIKGDILERSTSVRTVSGGAFESSRRKH